MWIKASRLRLLAPRNTDRFRQLYRRRGTVEREFGVFKHQWDYCRCGSGVCPVSLCTWT